MTKRKNRLWLQSHPQNEAASGVRIQLFDRSLQPPVGAGLAAAAAAAAAACVSLCAWRCAEAHRAGPMSSRESRLLLTRCFH